MVDLAGAFLAAGFAGALLFAAGFAGDGFALLAGAFAGAALPAAFAGALGADLAAVFGAGFALVFWVDAGLEAGCADFIGVFFCGGMAAARLSAGSWESRKKACSWFLVLGALFSGFYASRFTFNFFPMNLSAFVFSALLLALRPEPQEGPFTTISLDAVSNAQWTHVRQGPVGRAVLGGVPFDLPESRPAARTEGPLAKGPTLIHIPAEVARPEAIFILFSGTYVKPEFKGKKVGEITLEFTTAEKVTVPIIAGQTIRETWYYDNEIPEPDWHGNPKLLNVYSEPQARGGRPATGFLDMLVIDLERKKLGTTLTKITVKDTSMQTVHNIAPSLWVMGVTVRHE